MGRILASVLLQLVGSMYSHHKKFLFHVVFKSVSDGFLQLLRVL